MRGGFSKRISLNKNTNVNKKNVAGGMGMRGWGRVRWGLEKVVLYESKFKIIPGGWKRRGWNMARVSDCLFF